MTPFTSIPALYMSMIDGRLYGLSRGYFNDLIYTGSKWFKTKSVKTKEAFEMKDDVYPACHFTRFNVSYSPEDELQQDQLEYLQKLEYLNFES